MPGGREARIEGTWAGVRLAGVSLAGKETWFHVPSMNLLLDVGRCPTEAVAVPDLFLSHAHLDHAAGVAYWCSQRRLGRVAGGVVRTEPSTVPAWRELLSLHAALEGVTYDARVEPIAPGESVLLRKDLSVGAFAVSHRVPALGFVAQEVRHRLRAAWRGKPQAEIRQAIASGEEVSEAVSIPILAYSGDTAPDFFRLAPEAARRARVLLLECSFLEPGHRGRAAEWGHLHLDDVAEHADLLENEVVLLTHLTLRTRPDEIRRLVSSRLPARLASRAVPFLPG
ncbi:hypothetical protein FBQ97_04035 [Acidobacteria bacterium ACD]|nr:MAG: hypothetical protein EDX89_02005 [Acidobacteriota bacterium]MCE7959971.1 hypothetical protein [Acidobacteria bacterium ACB2]MDL1948966.1 hypothetical protein [Acidobacteria bacterium ACD]